MIEAIKERIKKRMDGETFNEVIMDEIGQTVTDRLCLRLGVVESAFPLLFQSIAVDACVKVWRKRYYEGISSENVANLSTSFIDDVLSEYTDEIETWLNSREGDISSSRKVVRFL